MTTKIIPWPTKIEPLPGSKSYGVDPKLVKAGSANPLPHPTSGLTSDVSLPAQAKAATAIVMLGTPEFDAEAHRIAAELGRLHQDGVIPNKSAQDPDASFYANLLHSFDATYIGKIGNVSSAVD